MASLVVNSSDEKVSLRALKQIHRLTTIDLYRQALGDALSDAINNYIYSRSKNDLIREKLVSNGGIEIFFYDFIEASCQMSASHMIKNITPDQWKRQSLTTIEFVIKQISKKIRFEGKLFFLLMNTFKFWICTYKFFSLFLYRYRINSIQRTIKICN